jgi:hypothetical protein
MKTIILIFTLILAGALISSHKKSSQNDNIEKIMSEGRPKILFLVSPEKGKVAQPASLWWNYKQTDNGEPGC